MTHTEYAREELELKLKLHNWVLRCSLDSYNIYVRDNWTILVGDKTTEFYYQSLMIGTVVTEQLRFEAMGWIGISLLEV